MVMKKYISTFWGHSEESTAWVAQKMVAKVSKKFGYEEFKIHPDQIDGLPEDEVIKKINYSLDFIEENSLFILQLPTWNIDLEYNELYLRELRKKVHKLVIFLHDFIPLMFENNLGYTEWFLAQYNQADLIILPSKKMKKWMRQYGLDIPVLIQGLWDHYTSMPLSAPKEYQQRVKFPGDPNKFQIGQTWFYDIPLDIYTYEKVDVQKNVTLHDFLSDESLLLELNKGGFGLVWAENTPNMPTKDYSTMCHSYKFSTFLAANLPIIVQKGMTGSQFITTNKLGFSVESLEDVEQVVKNCTKLEYFEMQKRIEPIAQMLREGFFIKKLLIEVEDYLFLN